jgi:hypothetical protein
MALAWYAYQTGSQSLKEEDLLVVEADKTPMKEKPSDPGGMQFPNQDKTIFDTFSGNNQQPAKVERVLPTPEEPMSKNMDNSETKTWINDKLHKPEPDKKEPEQVIGDSKDDKKPVELAVDEVPLFKVEPKADVKADKAEAEKKAKEEAAKLQADKAAKDSQAKAQLEKEAADKASKEADEKAQSAKDAADKAKSAKEAADKLAKEAEEKAKSAKDAEAKAKAEKEAADKLAKEKEAAEKAAKEKLAKEAEAKDKQADKPVAAPSGKYAVQLGAYRSEQEAKADWVLMQKKYKQFGTMQPVVVKADLGAKGTYYRLRTGTFSTSGEAKAFCNTMSILGQACILPTK